MVHINRFICAVKVNGKILRESNNLVTLPFGAEYSLVLKNLNSRRSMVNITVDGQDATEGKLIIGANGTVDLERFIRNGNLTSGNRFKFIERTAGIEAHRGIKAEDGLIRAEFWAEQEKPKETIETIIRRHYVDEYDPWPWYPYHPYPRPRLGGITWTSSSSVTGDLGDSNATGGLAGNFQKSTDFNTCSAQNMASKTSMSDVRPSFSSTSKSPLRGPSGSSSRGGMIGAKAMRAPMGATRSRKMRSFVEQERSAVSDVGITVPGSESHQQFVNVAGFPLESQSTVIVLQLRGEVGGVVVATPITVQHKPTCTTCGKVNKAMNKYCVECGTALILI